MFKSFLMIQLNSTAVPARVSLKHCDLFEHDQTHILDLNIYIYSLLCKNVYYI